MSRALGWGALGVFAGIQVLPAPPRTNPPVEPGQRIEAHLEIPPPIWAILQRSCHNCHSNETRWPWYSWVAPVSWKVGEDVGKARKIMNFSEWSEQAGQKLELAAGLLAASCSDVTVGRMPLREYTLVHTRAQLSPEDVKSFCRWTRAEGGRLMFRRRELRKKARKGL